MYTDYWRHLNQLSIATIVVAGGRVGSDFIQSLFDGHPEVLTFDGVLFFDDFYQNAVSLWGTAVQFSKKERLGKICLSEFFYEFAWKHLHAFKSKYDNLENKHKLGPSRDQSNEVDMDAFVHHATHLLASQPFNRRSAFLATHGAFCLARGEDLFQKKVLLHHMHDIERLSPLVEDFAKVKVIAAVRDPRAGYLSTMEHTSRYSRERVTSGMHAYVVYRILREASPLLQFPGVEVRVHLLEKLHQEPERVLKRMCQWLEIRFDPALLKSTWGGKLWWGDALSNGINNTFNPEMYEQSKRKWEERLFFQDKVLLEILMRKKIEQYGYFRKYKNPFWNYVSLLLIFFPNRVERSLLKECLKSFELKPMLRWLQELLRRYRWMCQKWLEVFLDKEQSFEFF